MMITRVFCTTVYSIDWVFRVLGTLGLYHVVITRLIGLKSDEKEGEMRPPRFLLPPLSPGKNLTLPPNRPFGGKKMSGGEWVGG